jgi:hypothetical protein
MKKLSIKCSFEKVGEYTGLDFAKGEKTKCGHYTACSLPAKGFGRVKWAIVAYLKVDYEKYQEEGYTYEQIVEGCINFLNKPPTRRHRKAPYGALEFNYSSVLEDKKLISVCFLVDQKKNKNFWGKGQRL